MRLSKRSEDRPLGLVGHFFNFYPLISAIISLQPVKRLDHRFEKLSLNNRLKMVFLQAVCKPFKYR